jgi:hypothetical protein
MVALRYLPGVPFFLIGLAALALIVRTRLREGAPGRRRAGHCADRPARIAVTSLSYRPP